MVESRFCWNITSIWIRQIQLQTLKGHFYIFKQTSRFLRLNIVLIWSEQPVSISRCSSGQIKEGGKVRGLLLDTFYSNRPGCSWIDESDPMKKNKKAEKRKVAKMKHNSTADLCKHMSFVDLMSVGSDWNMSGVSLIRHDYPNCFCEAWWHSFCTSHREFPENVSLNVNNLWV